MVAIQGIHDTCLKRDVIINTKAFFRKCAHLEYVRMEDMNPTGAQGGTCLSPSWHIKRKRLVLFINLAGTTMGIKRRGNGVVERGEGILPSSKRHDCSYKGHTISPSSGAKILRLIQQLG